MKIDPKLIFPKPGADAAAPASARDGVSTSRVAARASTEAITQPSPPTLMLPSTNGDFDAARVEKIREDIRAGRYQVNPAKIADGLLASVHELLDRKPS